MQKCPVKDNVKIPVLILTTGLRDANASKVAGLELGLWGR